MPYATVSSAQNYCTFIYQVCLLIRIAFVWMFYVTNGNTGLLMTTPTQTACSDDHVVLMSLEPGPDLDSPKECSHWAHSPTPLSAVTKIRRNHTLLRVLATPRSSGPKLQLGFFVFLFRVRFTSFHVHAFLLVFFLYFFVFLKLFLPFPPMRKCWRQHSCMSFTFSIVVRN